MKTSFLRLGALIALCLSTVNSISMAQGTGSIEGTVVGDNGAPLSGAKVNVEPVDGRTPAKLVRYVETDPKGYFSIDHLGWGKYGVFASKDEANYVNMYWTFYNDNSYPTATISLNAPVAQVQIRLGPKAGILTGSVTDALHDAPVNAEFKLIRAKSPDIWLSTSKPSNYRLLLPANTDVSIEVSAPGYKSWISSTPLKLQAGVETRLDISLEISRDPNLPVSEFLIPDGYVGWLRLEFSVKHAPPTATENNVRIFKFPKNGVLQTSSPISPEGEEKQYLYYAENGSTRDVPLDYRHGGGMVWGEREATNNGVLSEFLFFIGIEEQYKKQGYQGLQQGYPLH